MLSVNTAAAKQQQDIAPTVCNLTRAILNKSYDEARKLIDSNQNDIINQCDQKIIGMHPLFLVISLMSNQILKGRINDADRKALLSLAILMIRKGADPNLIDWVGQTLLYYVIAHIRSLELLRELIISGADCNFQNENGQTALHFAVAYNWVPAVESLLSVRDILLLPNMEGKTALYYACLAKNEYLVEALSTRFPPPAPSRVASKKETKTPQRINKQLMTPPDVMGVGVVFSVCSALFIESIYKGKSPPLVFVGALLSSALLSMAFVKLYSFITALLNREPLSNTGAQKPRLAITDDPKEKEKLATVLKSAVELPVAAADIVDKKRSLTIRLSKKAS